MSVNPLEKRLQIAGTLLIIGLLIEAICLLWARPISFVRLEPMRVCPPPGGRLGFHRNFGKLLVPVSSPTR